MFDDNTLRARAARAAGVVVLLASAAHAAERDPVMEETVVTGRAQSLLGLTDSASVGVVGATDLATRPILRAGELLEVVPGVAVTQHSGTGKANQYFLRGFNLDHGTDFAGFLDGVPLNQPTHGHGQGYLDLNPIIPEFVDHVRFGKGPYYAGIGDFSAAGHVRYALVEDLERPFVQFTGGAYDFYRGVAGAAAALGPGTLLAGFEAQHYGGPWVLDEDADKLNALLRYTATALAFAPRLTLTAYDADWNATDQVPARAIERGLISRRGNLDPTLGGKSTRLAADLALGVDDADDGWRANAYVVHSDFMLYSNFTYFLDDPVNGDQLTQRDRRLTTGMNSAFTRTHPLAGLPARWTVGAQLRHDDIGDVALLRSQARRPLATVREDSVAQTSLGLFLESEIRLARLWRTTIGVRADRYWFNVDSLLAANTGDTTDTLVTPKFALVFGPWRDTEWFVNVGQGFHSNDARGTVTRIDPASGAATRPVDPLVRATGAEGGVRAFLGGRLHSTVSVWYLDLGSELVFVGDAGTTEASGGSRRYGVELANFFRATDWLSFDLDVAFTEANFKDVVDDAIPNSVGRVITAGATIDLPSGAFGALRLRHFGDSPLTEDGRVEADATTVVNLRAGWRFDRHLELAVDVFNLFDVGHPDISYYFASCIPGDPASACGAALPSRDGVDDVHLHPVEPRSVRASLVYRF
ncbi:MAG: TonB-dependent receptor [Gammaproteobacteria bacterium]